MSGKVASPRSVEEHLDRVEGLSGRSLAWLASQRGWPVPEDQRRAKGWVGHLLEAGLGASAGSRAEMDFPQLRVELKTLPVDARGVPRESTWVCTAPVGRAISATWETSWVREKLSRVLFVPVVGDGALGTRMIGTSLLWSPTDSEDASLRKDWEELTELLALGEHWQLDARRGEVLQLRPKGADAADLAWEQDEEGEWVRVNPRGFYLRRSFTRALLARHFRLPARQVPPSSASR